MSQHMNEDELLALINRMNLGNETLNMNSVDEQHTGKNKGMIKIENNKITVAVGYEGQAPISIEGTEPVQILINGKVCKGLTFIKAGDRIDWQVPHEPLFRIEVSPDKIEAYLQIFSKERYGWSLKEQESNTHLVVEAVKDESIILETIGFADIIKKLQERSIIKNLRTPEIFQELQNPTFERILIARGVDPEPSTDAKLEVYFSEEIKSVLQENNRTQTIDFRNHLHIPSVKKGELIALKIPMKPGVLGYDVYGDIIQPEPPKDITIIAKENTEITSKGEVFALKDGRPRITGTGSVKYFDISTSFIVSGDVDIKTGNIVFSGDVIVYGNVTENMIIESLGNVYIFGNVFQATITATGSITVKGNIMSSNLYSGYFGVIFNRLYINCKALNEQLNLLIQASKTLIHLVESKGQVVRLGQVMMILIESKFKEIPRYANEALMCVQSLQQISANEMEELKENLHKLLEGQKILAFDSFNPIYAIQNMINETNSMVERMQEVSVNIDFGQAHLSNFKSTGDILIRKEGVLQSTLYCKSNVIFYDRDSVCRGGKIEALGTISAMTIGGDYGGETILKAGKRITLQKMTMGKISIGKYTREISNPVSNLTAYVRDQSLVIEADE